MAAKRVRTVLWVTIVAVALGSCGLLNELIPDQEFASGLLGIGEGLEIELAASAGTSRASVTPSQSGGTVFSGSFAGGDVIEGDASIPSWVRAKSVTDTVYLDRTLEANIDVAQFIVTNLGFAGTFSIEGQEYPIPFSPPVTDLALTFERRGCAGNWCTFEATAEPPVFRITLTKPQVSAFSNVIKNGGAIEVDVTVTMTVGSPALPGGSVAGVVVMTNGAVVKFR